MLYMVNAFLSTHYVLIEKLNRNEEKLFRFYTMPCIIAFTTKIFTTILRYLSNEISAQVS